MFATGGDCCPVILVDYYVSKRDEQYVFKVYKKNAITNVQLKSNSGHDPKILRGIFTGFLHHALTVCSQQHQQEEIDFLVQNFVDNGYQKHELIRILNEFQRKRSNPPPTPSENTDPTQIAVLHWVPGLSPKLRKSFRNAGYKAVFKSSSNLKSLLTSHNKSKLPPLSQPGVYMTSCGCGKKHVGETLLKVSTRIKQHQKSITDEKLDTTGVSDHASICKSDSARQRRNS